MKWAVIEENGRGDEWMDVYNSEEEAKSNALDEWNGLSQYQHIKYSIYVALINAEINEDGEWDYVDGDYDRHDITAKFSFDEQWMRESLPTWPRYYVLEDDAGNEICEVSSYGEALSLIQEYIKKDLKEDGESLNYGIKAKIDGVGEREITLNNCKYGDVSEIKNSRKVIFDTETTGLDSNEDEILQFSAIDGNGKILLNTYIKPVNHKSWEDAQAINHITPEMVANAPTLEEIKYKIQNMFDDCDEIIAYNAKFDIEFLSKIGIRFKNNILVSDPMVDFAWIYKEWSEVRQSYKWQKLTNAAKYYGYDFSDKAHDSLEDVKATLHVYNGIRDVLEREHYGRDDYKTIKHESESDINEER